MRDTLHVLQCMHACMHTSIHTCIHVFIHTCIHARIYIYIYNWVFAFLTPPERRYKNEKHIGYDLSGKKIIRKPRKDTLDAHLAKADDPQSWR